MLKGMQLNIRDQPLQNPGSASGVNEYVPRMGRSHP